MLSAVKTRNDHQIDQSLVFSRNQNMAISSLISLLTASQLVKLTAMPPHHQLQAVVRQVNHLISLAKTATHQTSQIPIDTITYATSVWSTSEVNSSGQIVTWDVNDVAQHTHTSTRCAPTPATSRDNHSLSSTKNYADTAFSPNNC